MIPGFSVLHSLPEFAQTHVHLVSDAIQSSHLLLFLSPLALNLSQHQGFTPMSQLFASDSQSTGASVSASVLPEYLGLISFSNEGQSLPSGPSDVAADQLHGGTGSPAVAMPEGPVPSC